jgi:hypothetical protein
MAPNDNIHGARSWRVARVVAAHRAFHDGFTEAMRGLPLDYRRLDAMTEMDQHRYENGREVALEWLSSTRAALRWSSRDRIPRALRDFITSRALQRAAQLPRTDPYRA